MQMPQDFRSLDQLPRLNRDDQEVNVFLLFMVSYVIAKMFLVFHRNKLTRLSVNANGSLIPKGCVDKNQIKKSPW